MRSFFLLACFCVLVAFTTAFTGNYWDVLGDSPHCSKNEQCYNLCDEYAKKNAATLKLYGCTKCSGWYRNYCQCYVKGPVNDSYYMDIQTSKGSCNR